MLEYLKLQNVGPSPLMEMDLAPRLNVITGDNGLGKTLLLDAVWFALARTWPLTWPGKGVVPTDEGATISWQERREEPLPRCSMSYDFAKAYWTTRFTAEQKEASELASLVVYARVDGGVAVSDSYRDIARPNFGVSHSMDFAPTDIWEGLDMMGPNKKTRVSEGLLRDWRTWGTDDGDPSFERFTKTLELLAPGEGLRPLRKWKRVFVDDAREVPLIQTPYGEVPIVHAAASMKRILGLAYVLVWAWREHLIAANLKKLSPLPSLVVLIDEIESHLHPQWQRRIAPALMGVADALRAEVEVQSIATTHSPLVLASLEPRFEADKDAWFDMDLGTETGSVTLRKRDFVRRGDASNWLTSEAFDLATARSVEAESAILEARAILMAQDPSVEEAERVDAMLHKAGLPDIDPFWVRWGAFLENLRGES